MAKKSLLIIGLVLLAVFLISSVYSMTVTFYYSDSCSYCQQIRPFVFEQVNNYPNIHFNIYETGNEANNEAFVKEGFRGVPAFKIITDDCREIKFVGADARRLNCELQEMTTEQCPTYYTQPTGGSWFMN